MDVGIIGLGGVSREHIRAYSRTPEAQVVALADLDGERAGAAQEYCSELGMQPKMLFSGENAARSLLNLGLDAVSITVPPLKRKEEILLAGKHCNLLIEKPLASDMASAERILDSLDQDRVYALCNNWQHTFLVKKLSELVRKKTFGSLRYVECMHVQPWQYDEGSWYTDVGYFFEHLVHDVSILRSINGNLTPSKVVCSGQMPNPSSVYFDFDYENGVPGSFCCVNGTGSGSLTLRLMFDRGPVVGFDSGLNPDYEWKDVGYFRIMGPDGEIFCSDLENKTWQAVNEQGVLPGLSHDAIVDDFVQAILEGGPPAATLKDGYDDMRILDEVYALFLCQRSSK